ncbi:MAG: lysoplasmalogenase [Spirochaetes bacterium]|nr:lysoplasmalogenase [Spirochaetota bacterium]
MILRGMSGAFTIILIFIAAFSFREYFAFNNNLKGKYFLTPLITLCVASVGLLAIGMYGISAYRALILMGIMCALVADTMLMVVEVDLLRFGILYFLVGHFFYIGAFSLDFTFAGWNAVAALLIALTAAIFFLKVRGSTGSMTIPVAVYLVVLSCMLFLAISGLNRGIEHNRVFGALGALLFAMSDVVLAVNAFVKKIPHSTVITWSMYAPAQMLLALSCFL